MAKKKLSHLDAAGRAKMVDVSDKAVTARRAMAEGFVLLLPETLRAIAGARGWSKRAGGGAAITSRRGSRRGWRIQDRGWSNRSSAVLFHHPLVVSLAGAFIAAVVVVVGGVGAVEGLFTVGYGLVVLLRL